MCFTAAACLNSRIILIAAFIFRPSNFDSGQDLSDSEDDDNAPNVQISECEMPGLLSVSDGEDDLVESQGTNVTHLTVSSNDDVLRSGCENDNDVVERYDENGTGIEGATDETDKGWSPARQSCKMKPKRRCKYAAQEKKPFCELGKKTIQNQTSELRKFAASMNLSLQWD